MYMRAKAAIVTIMGTGKKVIVHDVINARPARSGDNPSMIITIPKRLLKL
jgi:hypothetical protein